eukprot:COSAG01_NODE_57004_length_315_cov_0.685185_1_plen_105_part_11
MGTVRNQLAATVLNGKIYALGGFDGSSFVNTAEAYDPRTNTWTAIASMGTSWGGRGGGPPERQELRAGGQRRCVDGFQHRRGLRPQHQHLDGDRADGDGANPSGG